MLERSERTGFGSAAIAIVAPLAIIALAYALWWMSDRLLYVGPLDRAAFGWTVVIPIWVATPVVAGFTWAGLSSRASLLAAVVIGAAVGVVTAVLIWRAAAFPDCAFGANFTSLDWVSPSAFIGAIVGAGPATAGLVVAGLIRRGQRWRAIILGAALDLALVFVAIVVAGMTFMSMPACQRPPL